MALRRLEIICCSGDHHGLKLVCLRLLLCVPAQDLPTDSRMRRRALDLRPGALPVLDLGSPMDTETETDSDSDDGVYAPATTGWLEI